MPPVTALAVVFGVLILPSAVAANDCDLPVWDVTGAEHDLPPCVSLPNRAWVEVGEDCPDELVLVADPDRCIRCSSEVTVIPPGESDTVFVTRFDAAPEGGEHWQVVHWSMGDARGEIRFHVTIEPAPDCGCAVAPGGDTPAWPFVAVVLLGLLRRRAERTEYARRS